MNCFCGHLASRALDMVQFRVKIKSKNTGTEPFQSGWEVFLRASHFVLLCLRQMYFHSVFPRHPYHMSWVVFREPFLTFGFGPGCLALSLGMCVARDYCLNESLSKRNNSVYFILYLPETNSAFTRPSTFNFLPTYIHYFFMSYLFFSIKLTHLIALLITLLP